MTDLQSTTYLAFESFPSDPTNQYKSTRGEVSTRVFDDGDVDLTVVFSLAGNGVVTDVRFDAYASANLSDREEDAVAIAQSLADLEFLNNEWTAFYTAAKAAFDDIHPTG